MSDKIIVLDKCKIPSNRVEEVLRSFYLDKSGEIKCAEVGEGPAHFGEVQRTMRMVYLSTSYNVFYLRVYLVEGECSIQYVIRDLNDCALHSYYRSSISMWEPLMHDDILKYTETDILYKLKRNFQDTIKKATETFHRELHSYEMDDGGEILTRRECIKRLSMESQYIPSVGIALD